jgi:alpha-amylase
MPDLNWRSPAVRAEMYRIAEHWLERGVDGFRLDATRHLIETGPGAGQSDAPETHEALKELAARVRSFKPEAILVGENWTDTSTIAAYYGSTETVAGGDELPMNFDFPLAEAILAGVANGEAAGIAAKLAEVKALYPPGSTDAPFLTNHDNVRVATRLANEPAKLRNAAAILLTLPGTPFLYYGEEIGLRNGTTDNDEAKRTPMPWEDSAGGGFTAGTPWFPFAPGKDSANLAAQTGNAGSLLSRYRTLIRVRKSSTALRTGSIELLSPVSGASPTLVFLREIAGERVLVAHNLTDGVTPLGPYALEATEVDRLFFDGATGDLSRDSSGWRVTLPPRGSGVWRLR